LGTDGSLDDPRVLGIEMERFLFHRLSRNRVLDTGLWMERAPQVIPASSLDGRHRRVGQAVLRLAPAVEIGEKARRRTGAPLGQEKRRVSFDKRRAAVPLDRVAHHAIARRRRRALDASHKVGRSIRLAVAGCGSDHGDGRERSAHPLEL
jgi:hypothetical protein